MKKISKLLTGAAAAAVMTVSAAAPAEAQYRYRDRDRGIDVGDVITGVAIVGGIAAIASAIGNSGNRYDRDYGYGGYGYNNYGGGERAAVNACGYQADRYGRGRVSITDVDRRGSNSYRVRGVIQGDDYAYNRGYDNRSSRDYGYDRYDRGGQLSFSCTARSNGRVTDFDIDRRY